MLIYDKEQIEQEVQEKSKDNDININCNQNMGAEKSKCFFSSI